MKRSRSTWFAVAVLGGSIAFQPLAYADDFGGRAAAEMDKIYNQRLDQIRRSNDPPEVKAQKIRQLADEYNAAMGGGGTNGGMAGAMNRTGDAIANGRNANNQPRQPGFWDKAGEKALDIIAELLKQAISNWMNKPTEENLRKIEALERERDRLMNERNNPVADNPANGFGRPVYDSNGNVIGWDRDGDGRPDSTDTNGDGRPDNFNGGSNDNGYADPYEYLDGGAAGGTGGAGSNGGSRPIYDGNGTLLGFDTDGDGRVDLAASNPAGAGNTSGGGASTGGTGGAGVSGGVAAGGVAEGDDKEKEDKEKEDKEKELAAADEGKDGVKTGKEGKTADGKRDRNNDGVDDDRQLEVVMGRIIVLPKVDPLNPDATPTPGVRPAAGGAANVRPGTAGAQPGGPAAAPTKPLEDDWNDAEDNGDKGPDDWGEEWGDEWGDGSGGGAGGAQPGKPTKPGEPAQPGQPGATRARPSKETEIVDQLIKVETVIAEWRKQAKEEAQGARDPYAFHDGAGMQGADGKTEDPLAEYRLPDGKVDLTRVDIWIVERDSWKEGQEPRRFQVTVDEAAIDQFEPMPGHYVMCRGVMSKVETLDPRVLDEIKGAVKKLDLVQVVLQSETPPEEGLNPDGTPKTPAEPGAKPSGTKPNPGGGSAPTDEDW